MRAAFHVTGSSEPRPPARRTIYADGAADASFRDAADLELSHWIPNRTPRKYRADTSTAICLRFAEDPARGEWDLVVNNHVDVDGMLGTFALVEPELALPRRELMIGAAEMGDFWAWADEPAAALFQGVTLLMDETNAGGADPLATYRAVFERLPHMLAGSRDPSIDPGMRALLESARLLDSGAVRVHAHSSDLVRFEIPRRLAEGRLSAALRVPRFNEALSGETLLLCQARNRDHGGRIQLVSVEGARGWFHDLWYPGWCWADTERRIRPVGLVPMGTNHLRLDHPPLADAIRDLATQERAPGRWALASNVTPFDGLPERGFPVVASFLDADGRPAPSSIPPDAVGARLAPAFAPRLTAS